jgi:glycosyltransferase involved in cell wall biosynthesis
MPYIVYQKQRCNIKRKPEGSALLFIILVVHRYISSWCVLSLFIFGKGKNPDTWLSDNRVHINLKNNTMTGNNLPGISLITVVFNDAAGIEKTILSIISQTWKDLEYVIIDGGSGDGTLDIIRKYEDRITRWISEPDEGLYDAMNKGLKIATGEYVWFINSGDQIYAVDTIEKMFRSSDINPDIYYGGTMIIDANGNEIGDRRLKPPLQLSWRSFRNGMLVCHQSIVVRRMIAVEYDLKYRISADIDWIIRVTRNAQNINNTGLVLSRFLEGGVSRTKVKQGLKERFAIMSYYYGFIPTLLRHVLFGARLLKFYLRYRRI